MFVQWFGITDYPAFALAVLVFLMIPGPGTFALLASTAQRGLRGGDAALAGRWLSRLAGVALIGFGARLTADS